MAARNRFGISAIAVLIIGLFAVCVCAEHRPDEILIKYKVGRQAQAQMSASSLGAQPAQPIDRIRFQRFKLPQGLSVEQAMARFKNDPNVEYVGPVNIIRPCLEPNDNLYINGMTITTEDIFGDIVTETYTQWWLDSINGVSAPQAWDVNTGAASNIIIAIVDSGVKAGPPRPGRQDDPRLRRHQRRGADDPIRRCRPRHRGCRGGRRDDQQYHRHGGSLLGRQDNAGQDHQSDRL